MRKAPRPLSAQERVLFLWCAQGLPEHDSAAFREQIATAQVVLEEGGHLGFEVPLWTRTVISKPGLDLHYSDPDGTRVEFMISFVSGRLSWVDRYRITGGDPEIAVPDVKDAHLDQ